MTDILCYLLYYKSLIYPQAFYKMTHGLPPTLLSLHLHGSKHVWSNGQQVMLFDFLLDCAPIGSFCVRFPGQAGSNLDCAAQEFEHTPRRRLCHCVITHIVYQCTLWTHVCCMNWANLHSSTHIHTCKRRDEFPNLSAYQQHRLYGSKGSETGV